MVHFLCNKKEHDNKKGQNAFIKWGEAHYGKSTLFNLND